MTKGNKVLEHNKNANRSYFLVEKWEAGLVLSGTEVKSLRAGRGSLKGAYAVVKGGEIYLKNMHIKPYEYGNINNHKPIRDRKLLLHKAEISKISGKIKERGYTLIPVKVYLTEKGKIKLEIALAKGKTGRDKRSDIKEREAKRDISRALKKKFT